MYCAVNRDYANEQRSGGDNAAFNVLTKHGGTISDEAISRYARAYSQPGQMAAAMHMYRAKDGENSGRERREPLEVPFVLAGGAVAMKGFGELLPAVAKGLKDAGVRSVAVETIAGSGHYVVDEKPEEVAALIERYASVQAQTPNQHQTSK